MLPREFPGSLDVQGQFRPGTSLDLNSFNFTGRPVLQGVDSLFDDYQGSQMPEFDFNHDLLPGSTFMDTRHNSWQRADVPVSSYPPLGVLLPPQLVPPAAQFGAMPSQAQQTGQWRGGWLQEEHRGDIEHSSGDSQQLSAGGYKPDLAKTSPTPPVDVSMSDSFPTMQPSRRSAKAAASLATQAEKDRERAEKLKEKNKRAQRKFRQRQKDRQESAEKQAGDLAEQLKAMSMEKEALEARNRQLEEALAARTSSAGLAGTPASAADATHPPEDREPTFVPAQGWQELDTRGGMILLAICQPPRKLTHRQILALSLRDLSIIMTELVVRLRDCLKALEQDDPNTKATATARIQALISERHCLVAYLAVNAPNQAYKIWSTKMSDPPVLGCTITDQGTWVRVLEKVKLTEEQKANMMVVRRMYIQKVGGLVAERHALRQQLQALEVVPEPTNLYRVPTIHLQWNTITDQIRQNLDLTHRCHGYFMSRMYFSDIFTPIQVAELITAVHPYPVDPFTICLLVASQMGEPDYMDMLQEAVGKDSTGATLPLDEYVQNWPEPAVPRKGSAEPEDGEGSVRERSPGHIFARAQPVYRASLWPNKEA